MSRVVVVGSYAEPASVRPSHGFGPVLSHRAECLVIHYYHHQHGDAADQQPTATCPPADVLYGTATGRYQPAAMSVLACSITLRR